MNKNFLNYLLQIAGIACLYMALYVLMKDFLGHYFYPSWWKIGIFFFMLFAINHFFRLKKKGPSESVRFFMASTALKLFLMLIIITVYLFMFRNQAIAFTLSFCMAYFMFMSFDAAKAYKYMKQNP